MTVSADQKRRMQAGRERARNDRERLARKRVRGWRRWIAAGCPQGSMPEVPTDSDFRVAGRTR